MLITAVEVVTVAVPFDVPYAEADGVSAVVARVQTDQGLEGLGHVIPLSTRHVRSLATSVDELAGLLIGDDPTRPEAVHRKLVPGGTGNGGAGNLAAAVLDIAMWDLTAKAAGLPLYRLLGGYRDRIPVYASLRLGRPIPPPRLAETAAALVDQGFRAMKMNLGAEATLNAELERVRAVRDAVGPHIDVLVDVNSRWTPAQALRACRALREFDLFWLEDPVPIHHLDAHAEVRRGAGIPIATGEALFSLAAFRPVFQAGAVDIPMPDLPRVGGITAFLKIAHMAEAFGLPIACHLLPEISSQVVAAVPNGLIVEYVPWAWQLFDGGPHLDHGELVMPEAPGHGLTLNEDYVKAHRTG